MKCIVLLLCYLLWITPSNGRSRNSSDVSVGDTLPSFSVITNYGECIHSDVLNGKPLLVVFFHTKCYDCRRELPEIQKLYSEYGAVIEFLAISREEEGPEVLEFWNKNKLTIPYSAQKDKSIYHLFAEKTIPRIYISDDQGVVRKTFKEKVSYKRLRKSIKSLLKKYNNLNINE